MISPGGWKEKFEKEPPPMRPVSRKTMREMYAGRRHLQVLRYEKTMPPVDFHRFKKWIEAFQ